MSNEHMKRCGCKDFICFKYIEWPDGRRKALSIYKREEGLFVEKWPVPPEAKDLDQAIELSYQGAKVVETVTYEDIMHQWQKDREEKSGL